MAQKTILLTGAGGCLGTAVQRSAAHTSSIHLIPKIHRDLNITDSQAVTACLESLRPHYVLNAAAFTNVDKAELDPQGAFGLNVQAVRNLVQACARTGSVLMHISTDYVFDGRDASAPDGVRCRPYAESDATHPLGVYGATKWEGEQEVLAYERGIVLRVSWLYDQEGRNFLSSIPRLLVAKAQEAGRPPLMVESLQRNAPTYAPHLVTVLFEAVRQGLSHGLYHACGTGGCSRLAFACAVQHALQHAGVDVVPAIPLADAPNGAPSALQGADRPMYSVMSSALLSQTLGVSIPTWEEGAQALAHTFTTRNQ